MRDVSATTVIVKSAVTPHEDMQVIRFARDVARNHNDQAGHHRMDAEIGKADEASDHHLIQHGARTPLTCADQLSAPQAKSNSAIQYEPR